LFDLTCLIDLVFSTVFRGPTVKGMGRSYFATFKCCGIDLECDDCDEVVDDSDIEKYCFIGEHESDAKRVVPANEAYVKKIAADRKKDAKAMAKSFAAAQSIMHDDSGDSSDFGYGWGE
jgi:hypothetical protein